MTRVQSEEDISHDVTVNKNWQRIDNPSDKRWSGVVLVVVLLSEPGPALSAASQQKLFIHQSTYWMNDLVGVQPPRTLLVFQENSGSRMLGEITACSGWAVRSLCTFSLPDLYVMPEEAHWNRLSLVMMRMRIYFFNEHWLLVCFRIDLNILLSTFKALHGTISDLSVPYAPVHALRSRPGPG